MYGGTVECGDFGQDMSVDVTEVGDGEACSEVIANSTSDDVSVFLDLKEGVEVDEVGRDDVSMEVFTNGKDDNEDD